MSKTIVDMPKVTQKLDAGWRVTIYRGPMGSYEVRACHHDETRTDRMLKAIAERYPEHATYEDQTLEEAVEFMHMDDEENVMTDDFTPEQALTRMAYKIHGEIL